MSPSIFRRPGETQEQAEKRISTELQDEADAAGVQPDPVDDTVEPEESED